MINCIIIDDEPLALSLIEDYVRRTSFLDLKFSSTSSLAGLTFINNNKVDLVFADIKMPDINGMQMMKLVDPKIKFILISAYSEYAIEGYEYNVLDYLLKPIDYGRFYKACQKAYFHFQQFNNRESYKELTKDFLHEYIFLRTESKIIKVALNEILFVKGLKEYLLIQTSELNYIILESFKNLEEKLPKDQFLRVHKSFIISLSKILSIERNRIFISDYIIPIGDSYKAVLFAAINAKKIG